MLRRPTPSPVPGIGRGDDGSFAPIAFSKEPASSSPDAGLRSLDHYRNKLPQWRYLLRQRLIPMVRWETPYLAHLQTTMRTPALDSYFAVTANLGTHTFFMIMLPILFWCGHTSLGRGMVHVLAAGVFFSGWIKDFLCLPRPLSPPLQRITMSGSAALEYGFPSTHSTNALSVVVYAIYTLHSPESTVPHETRLILEGLAYCYAFSILLGRLYCGMHGFLDVLIGGSLGALLSVLQCQYGEAFDRYVYSSGTYHGPLVVVMIICILVRTHPEPADDCPCFDDSVAFAGVMIGVEVGNWHYAGSGWAWNEPVLATVPFSVDELGYVVIIARVLFGVTTIFLWREVMKPTLLRGLPPLFRQIEKLGLTLPRRFFVQASEYQKVPPHLKDDNVIPTLYEFPSLLRKMRHPRKRAVSVGPQSAADAYETLAYRHKQRTESNSSITVPETSHLTSELSENQTQTEHISHPTSSPSKPMTIAAMNGVLVPPSGASTPGAERPPSPSLSAFPLLADHLPEQNTAAIVTSERQAQANAADEKEDKEMFSRLERPRVRYDVEVVTKLVVYAGIALLAVEVNPILFEWVGLGMGVRG